MSARTMTAAQPQPETAEREQGMSCCAPRRPVLRYHGGKFKLADWVIAHFPPHRVYVEPFGGAASVLMQKPRSYGEVINDLDGEVVNLFRVLRDRLQAQELERALRLTPYARDEFFASYEPTKEPVEWARRTVIRAFMGFGSDGVNDERQTGFRANSNRRGTTPAHDWVSWPRHVSAFTARLQAVVIENRPAAEIIAQQDGPETLFYVDPPYPHCTRLGGKNGKVKTYRHEMSDDDHRALAHVLRSVRGMVVLSGYPCALYDEELYPDWHRVTKGALADGARARVEVLWLNRAAQDGLAQGSLGL